MEIGGIRFEFLEPSSPASPIFKFLEKRGPGIHHLALEVKDILKSMSDLKAQGVSFLSERPKVGAHGTQVAFIHPKATTSGILIELVQGN